MSEPDPTPGSITLAFAQLRAGGEQGVDQLWQRFFPRLLALARKTLTTSAGRMADAEDAVQSAFFSFYQRSRAGEFGDLMKRDDLWRLLGVITARKAVKQVQRERALKRGGGKVISEAALAGGNDPMKLAELAVQLPTHEFDLCCEELIEMLDEPLRPYAVLRLLGHKNREIAEYFVCTERKVERKLNLVRLKWEQAFNRFE